MPGEHQPQSPGRVVMTRSTLLRSPPAVRRWSNCLPRSCSILHEHLSAGVLRRLEGEKPLAQRSQGELYALVVERVVEPEVVEAWPLFDSLSTAPRVRAAAAADYPAADCAGTRGWT